MDNIYESCKILLFAQVFEQTDSMRLCLFSLLSCTHAFPGEKVAGDKQESGMCRNIANCLALFEEIA